MSTSSFWKPRSSSKFAPHPRIFKDYNSYQGVPQMLSEDKDIFLALRNYISKKQRGKQSARRMGNRIKITADQPPVHTAYGMPY